MANKKKRKEEEDKDDIDLDDLTNELVKELNKNSEDKIAWNLARDDDNPTDVKEFISTGSTLLDYAISNRKNGGVPVGKLTELSGEEASGKSLVCAHLIADAQRKGGIAVYIDTENACNPEFMKQVGVDVNKMVYMQPETIEQVGENIEKAIIMTRAKAKDKLVLIIWDSIAGTPSQAEVEGNYDPNDRIGVTAKALGKLCRKIMQSLGKERISLVFTNQTRVKIGTMYGDPITTPGGKAIPFFASVRVRLTRSTEVKDDTEKDKSKGQVYAINTNAKVIKNRLGPPLRKCSFKINFSSGIDDVESWFNYLHERGEVVKKGGWCLLEKHSDKTFREKDWAKFLEENADARQYVLDYLDKKLTIKYGEIPEDAESDPESLMESEAEGT
jgi:recombination protein RecA